jgi:hypothetical protein
VIDDPEIPDGTTTAGGSPFAPINSVHAADIDGDGRPDIAATLDRDGVNDDIVVWLKNTSIEEP